MGLWMRNESFETELGRSLDSSTFGLGAKEEQVVVSDSQSKLDEVELDRTGGGGLELEAGAEEVRPDVWSGAGNRHGTVRVEKKRGPTSPSNKNIQAPRGLG